MSELPNFERRLRELQRDYYELPVKDDRVILEYLSTLAQARSAWASEVGRPLRGPRLHLGCGDHRLGGWINVDLEKTSAAGLLTDTAKGLPFADGSVAFVHCEDLLEHLDFEGGVAMLAECRRVLRDGGVLRILTPDLRALVEKVYRDADPRQLAWCDRELSATGPCQALNAHLRMSGEHRFVYDEEELTRVLRSLGFEVGRVRWNESQHPELRYLDLRDFGLNLFLEATRTAGTAVNFGNDRGRLRSPEIPG
jgi:predicted SAM-dependent methyltransferase